METRWPSALFDGLNPALAWASALAAPPLDFDADSRAVADPADIGPGPPTAALADGAGLASCPVFRSGGWNCPQYGVGLALCCSLALAAPCFGSAAADAPHPARAGESLGPGAGLRGSLRHRGMAGVVIRLLERGFCSFYRTRAQLQAMAAQAIGQMSTCVPIPRRCASM